MYDVHQGDGSRVKWTVEALSNLGKCSKKIFNVVQRHSYVQLVLMCSKRV